MKNFIGILFFYFLMLGNAFSDPASVTSPTAVVPPSISAPSLIPSPAPVTPATPMTLEQATKQIIGNNYAGRVLSAKTEEIDGHKVHVVKTLTLDGRIQQQTIDVETGALININDSKNDTPKE